MKRKFVTIFCTIMILTFISISSFVSATNNDVADSNNTTTEDTTNATDEATDTVEQYVTIGDIFIISQGIVQDFSIDGVTYDESKNVLTLNNFTGTSIYIQNKTISIEILGTNTLKPENGTAFQTNNSIDTTITFKGTGVLNMTCDTKDTEVVASYGGAGWASLIIDGPTINVTGYNYAIHGLGIEVRKGMLVAKCIDGISTPIQDGFLPKYSDNMQYIDNGSTIIIKEHEIITNKDNGTKVKLDATTKELPEDTEIIVNKVTNGEIYNLVVDTLNDIADKVQIYDISLMSNDIAIQPNGNVKISMPIPEDIDTSKLVVYRIADNGEKTEYNAIIETIENVKYATFETDHFSTYVLAEKKEEQQQGQQLEEEKQPEQEKQPENTQTEQEKDDTVAPGILPNAGIGISIIAIIFAVIVMSVITYNRYNKMKDIK